MTEEFPMPKTFERVSRTEYLSIRCDSSLKNDLYELIPNTRSRTEWINDWIAKGLSEIKKRKHSEK